jgi:hypothetical protein
MLQPDQLAVELVEHLADTDLVELAAQVDAIEGRDFIRALWSGRGAGWRTHAPP